MKKLNGKVVVITGASSGIGEAMAKESARVGAKVVLGARQADKLEALCKAIEADSLEFLSEESLLKAGNRKELCMSCFNGCYPTSLYQNKLSNK